MTYNIQSAPSSALEHSRSASNDIAAAFESSLHRQQPSSANNLESQNIRGRPSSARSTTRMHSARKELGQGIAIGATVVGILGFIGTLASMPAWMPGDEGGRKKNSF